MKWENFKPKLPLAVCAGLMIVAFIVVMRNGVTAVQNVSESELPADPMQAILATALMAAIGLLVYIERRIHGR